MINPLPIPCPFPWLFQVHDNHFVVETGLVKYHGYMLLLPGLRKCWTHNPVLGAVFKASTVPWVLCRN